MRVHISRFSSFMAFWIFVFFGVSGCATYNETVVVNTDKFTVFENFEVWPSLDYRQIYYDPAKKIEIFAPTLSSWELTTGRSQKPSDILVFEGVTRPIGCPLTSKSSQPYLTDNPGDAYCYWGNGRLKGYFKSDDLLQLIDTNDYQGLALRTIYQAYFERERQDTLRRMVSCNCSKEDAEELLARDRIIENWAIVRANHDAYSFLWGNRSISNFVDFEERVANDETFLARAIQARAYNRQNTRSETVNYYRPVERVKIESSDDFDLFDLLIDAAVDIWVYKEKAKISQEQLDKIYEESRKGSRAGMRSTNRQKEIMNNLKIKPKIGCESYGC